MARFVVMCVKVSRDSRGPSLAGFLFIENWDSGGFCGHKSGHSSWQTYHMGWYLDRVPLGREFLVPAAGGSGHTA